MTARHGRQHTRLSGQRGSGLIIVLSVLAMVAVIATTFIALTRLDVRITGNYVDDLRCETLARGVLNYFKGLLRDDLDRTWGKYENRDTGVGGYASWNYGTGGLPAPQARIPGRVGYQWGTPVSNDFWMSCPEQTWGTLGGGLYVFRGIAIYGLLQQSFAWEDHTWRSQGMIGRYYDADSDREYDAWLGRSYNAWDRFRPWLVVASNHPNAGAPIDDDGDGVYNPTDSTSSAWFNENQGVSGRYGYGEYYDNPPMSIFSGTTYYWPGTPFTGEASLPGTVFWRWGVKVGPTQSSYANLNVHGNLDGADSSYLNDIGGVGLQARRADDEQSSTIYSEHLGRIEWKGFSSDYDYKVHGGFPQRFNNTMVAPSAASLEGLFSSHEYVGSAASAFTCQLDRARARDLIRYRWGNDGRPADGTHKWRNGWRRDGATYFKPPSPEAPLDDDRYFGMNEVLEHDHSVNHSGTSAVAGILGEVTWRKLRPYLNMWSTDTMLRGKIWPTEGPPYTSREGDWRHIDILKRVNINIIGASGPDGMGNDVLKLTWAGKRRREQDRLYYMLMAALKFTDTGAGDAERRRMACQFIASLSDMVDRDQDETCYVAPDASGVWALGVEKHPVINEVAVHLTSANSKNYVPETLRVELYNPMENIPWIPDTDEAYDISDYVLKIGSRTYRLGDLRQFSYGDVDSEVGPITRIGADGMYSEPGDPTANRQSWSRLVHIGWPGGGWPTGLDKTEIYPSIEISLWKPLNASLPGPAPGVSSIGGRQYVCVDHTGFGSDAIRLVRPHGTSTTPAGPGSPSTEYLGLYRRWDPTNARVYGTEGTGTNSNVIWVSAKNLTTATLGRPNTGYPAPWSYSYGRKFEQNFKVVDGDLPSAGWLGELMMRNCAQDGPFTWVHQTGQNPSSSTSANQLDTHAKFDLFRPFRPMRKYSPVRADFIDTDGRSKSANLHVLDIFTVWDPSNDGLDNDGDGAIDDEDSGCQPGDKGGPEVRVFGRLDLNMICPPVMGMLWPDGAAFRTAATDSRGTRIERFTHYVLHAQPREWSSQNSASQDCHWGPFETVGDLLRADWITCYPGLMFCGSWNTNYASWSSTSSTMRYFDEYGITSGDDDGDGIVNERDERDMIFTWICNHFTTRANVFSVNLSVDICAPPYYPKSGRQLPFRVNKTQDVYAHRQLVGILDRSSCLRIGKDAYGRPGPCDFTGPVEVRMMRITDDLKAY